MQCESQVLLIQVMVSRTKPLDPQPGHIVSESQELWLCQFLCGVFGASRSPDFGVDGLERSQIVVHNVM